MSGFGSIKKLEEGDYYLSPEGYKVFTEQYHLKSYTTHFIFKGLSPEPSKTPPCNK